MLIPGSPHSFALEVSNVASNTYRRAARAASASRPVKRMYGFEFTIPLHLSRFGAWFHGGAGPALGATGPAAAEVQVAALKYSTDTVRVAAGQIVRWINHDPLDHTITFDVEGPASGRAAGQGELRGEVRPGGHVSRSTVRRTRS